MVYFSKTPFWAKLVYPSLIWDMPAGDNRLFLTFDDGPHPDVTCYVLSELEKYNAKATFFCVGENVLKYPRVFQKIVENGHTVGNHTYNHLKGWKTPAKPYLENVEKAQQLINGKIFRPPYGKFTSQQYRMIASPRLGLKNVMWSVLSGDFDKNISSEQCFKNIIKHAVDGSIIVFHDSEKARQHLEFALPKTLQYFAEKGFKFEGITVLP